MKEQFYTVPFYRGWSQLNEVLPVYELLNAWHETIYFANVFHSPYPLPTAALRKRGNINTFWQLLWLYFIFKSRQQDTVT